MLWIYSMFLSAVCSALAVKTARSKNRHVENFDDIPLDTFLHRLAGFAAAAYAAAASFCAAADIPLTLPNCAYCTLLAPAIAAVIGIIFARKTFRSLFRE